MVGSAELSEQADLVLARHSMAALRQYRSRPLMVCRYSAPERWAKSGLVYMCSPFPAFFSPHKIAVRRTTPEIRPFCHPSRPYAPPCRAYLFAASPSKPCKNQRSSAPISAAAVPFYASLPPRPAPFKAVLSRVHTHTRARAWLIHRAAVYMLLVLYKSYRRKIFPIRPENISGLTGRIFRSGEKRN